MGELAQTTALLVRPRASSAKSPYMPHIQRCALGPRASTFNPLVVPVAVRECLFWAVGHFSTAMPSNRRRGTSS
jgi:hypothetical protein